MLRTNGGEGRDLDGWGTGTLPETVLPVQLFAQVRGLWQPEKRLMLAVLENALSPLLRNPARRHGRMVERRPLTAEVKAWIASDAGQWPFSFVNICHVLGLDEDALRAALLGRGTGGPRSSQDPTRKDGGSPRALMLGEPEPSCSPMRAAGGPADLRLRSG
jgi:hypothetical protein